MKDLHACVLSSHNRALYLCKVSFLAFFPLPLNQPEVVERQFFFSRWLSHLSNYQPILSHFSESVASTGICRAQGPQGVGRLI